MHRYKVWNGPMPTTSAQGSVATANGVKTVLQLATPSSRQIQLISWGYSFDVASAGIMTVELLQTDVAASGGTAHVAAGVQPLDPNAPASLLQLGAALTGYAFTTEGSTTAARVFDARKQPIAAAGAADLSYAYQWMPDERPIVAVSKFLRVRITATTTTPSVMAWICWDE